MFRSAFSCARGEAFAQIVLNLTRIVFVVYNILILNFFSYCKDFQSNQCQMVLGVDIDPDASTDDVVREAALLRPIRQREARNAAVLFGLIKKAAKGLRRIEKRIKKNSIAAVGENYDSVHVVGFERYGTNDEQMEEGAVLYPDLESVEKMATECEIEALGVANADKNVPLPSEEPYLFVKPRG